MFREIIFMQFLVVIFFNMRGYENCEMPYLKNVPSREFDYTVDVTSEFSSDTVLNLFMEPNQYPTCKNNESLHISGYIACAVGLYKMTRDYIAYDRWLRHLSYHEFMTTFPYLLEIEEQIVRIQDLLYKSSHGTFPEKVAARINLVRLSLTSPYDKIMRECSEHYFNTNFNELGHFIWHESDDAYLSYKKFYKKIPQDFRKLARCSKKISQTTKNIYVSSIASKTENAYNQTLLDIVYAGICENYPLLKKLCRTYYDKLFEKLYQYYIDQKILKHDLLYQDYQDTDSYLYFPMMYDSKNRDVSEEAILREWYSHEMMSWIFSLQPYDKKLQKTAWSLLSKDQILELPFNPNYRFVLLKKCLDEICVEDKFGSETFDDLFLPCGILKKYKNHTWLPNNLNGVYLSDVIMQKAVNFSLAICEKEYDETTQKVAKLLLQYVFCAYDSKDDNVFAVYKNKIVVLYEALSYKRYDLNILKI